MGGLLLFVLASKVQQENAPLLETAKARLELDGAVIVH
jgi:hypothetical protein